MTMSNKNERVCQKRYYDLFHKSPKAYVACFLSFYI
nr:MAG TPA: hypothetical protein [Bacteriophage sp.]